MYGDQSGEFVCGSWGLKCSVRPKSAMYTSKQETRHPISFTWKSSSKNRFLSISPPHATSKKWQVLPGLQGQLDEASSSFQSKNIRARKHGKNFRGTSNNNGNWMPRALLSQYKLAAFMADTYDTKTHYNVTKDWRPTHICEREAKNTQVCQYITNTLLG